MAALERAVTRPMRQPDARAQERCDRARPASRRSGRVTPGIGGNSFHRTSQFSETWRHHTVPSSQTTNDHLIADMCDPHRLPLRVNP
jgi:hypothetical protein